MAEFGESAKVTDNARSSLRSGPEEESMKSKLVGVGLVAGVAWMAYNQLRDTASLTSDYDASTRILVASGGFGGLAAARELARALDGSEDVADWTIELFARADTSKLFEDSKQPTTGA